MPPLGRATCSIETTVLFGLEPEAVALPALAAPCAPLAVSDAAPAVLAVPEPEVVDWS
jgi:hypothetical protein